MRHRDAGRALRVLCLDAEGGHGGSSRSLAASLRWIDRSLIEPTVWCRRGGAIEQFYDGAGVRCEVNPDMPRVGALRRLSRNIYSQAVFQRDWLKARAFRQRLLEASKAFDVVHFNLETLCDLAEWLRRRSDVALTMHVRTRPAQNAFGRRQCRKIARSVDQLVYITENEQCHFVALAGRAPPARVIYNIADLVGDAAGPAGWGEALRVAVLSNYDYMRGIDRCIEIAECLAARGRRDVKFVIAGDMKLARSLPGELGQIGSRGGTLDDYARLKGVADMFEFLGHVSAPEKVLAGCHVLIKPTREDNPWGRDILEALGHGRPVISCGTYDRFVETGVTGVLLSPFDAGRAAEVLIDLDRDRARLAAMGAAAHERVRILCNGSDRARELTELWRAAIAGRAA